MKPAHFLSYLVISFTCFTFSFNTQAQIRNIAIVSVADTTCIHRHVGLTAFTNFIDTLHVNFPIIHQIEGKLMTYLSQKYTVSVVQLPDSVLAVKNTFFSSKRDKKIKQWITYNMDLYDLVIVIDNMELSENYRMIPKYTSGIYSGSYYASYFSTMTFYAYRSSNLKPLDYYHEGGKFMQENKDFKIPNHKKSITPEMMILVNDGFKSYLDQRVEYFLVKSYLFPQDRIDVMKAEPVTTK